MYPNKISGLDYSSKGTCTTEEKDVIPRVKVVVAGNVLSSRFGIIDEILYGARKSGANAEAIGIPADIDDSAIGDFIGEFDAIIFGSPTYFGCVSAETKKFFDSTLDIFKKRLWRNKIAAGFTYSSSPSGDKLKVLENILLFAAQHGMFWAGMDLFHKQRLSEEMCELLSIDGETKLNHYGGWLGLMLSGVHDTSQHDIASARYMGHRIAESAIKMLSR